MSNDIQLDALPYIDQGYEEPGVREAVRKALEGSPNKGASFILINASPGPLRLCGWWKKKRVATGPPRTTWTFSHCQNQRLRCL